MIGTDMQTDRRARTWQNLQVVLGSQTIKAFVTTPREFTVVGIVRLGMEFGILATSEAGAYVRVNGSTITPLHQPSVEEAIRLARSKGRGESYATSRLQTPAQAAEMPMVLVRKRRQPMALLGDKPTASVGAPPPARKILRCRPLGMVSHL